MTRLIFKVVVVVVLVVFANLRCRRLNEKKMICVTYKDKKQKKKKKKEIKREERKKEKGKLDRRARERVSGGKHLICGHSNQALGLSRRFVLFLK